MEKFDRSLLKGIRGVLNRHETEVLSPEAIRRYKLNLMGKRAIDAGGEQSE